MYISALELHEATSYEDAAELLSRYSPDVRLLAGGTDVLIDLKNNGNGVGHLVTVDRIESVDGQIVDIVNISANVVDFADTSGVSELNGAYAMGQWQTLALKYVDDRWVEFGRSAN